MVDGRLFGASVRRIEDPRILTGHSEYLDDIGGASLHVAVVRSPLAHARLTGIDVSRASESRGVVAVVTASDLGSANGPFPHPSWFPANDTIQAAANPELQPEHIRLLASDVVRYAGEAIAAVVATDPYLAADAASEVGLELDPLPVLASPDEALQPDAPIINEGWTSNIAAHFVIAAADPDGAFQSADHVVRGVFFVARQTGTPIEPRGAYAAPERVGGGLTMWSSTQIPHWLRDALVVSLGLPPDKIRVVAPDVGGGFGIKSMIYPEELLVAALALRLDGPVKWLETRSEHFLSAVHSRDQRHDIELALRSDGVILGLRDRFVVDTGASNVEALIVPYNTAAHLQGPYRVPNVYIECTCVVTNKSPLSSYRGAGRPEAVFAMDRILDRAAKEIGLDPAEIRRRNLLAVQDMPYDAGIFYRDGNRLVIDGGDPRGCLERALEEAGYEGWRGRQQTLRDEGRYVGIGISCYIEGTGIGPYEVAEARIDPSGRVVVSVAFPSQGQGHETTLAQICADQLGVRLEDVRVRQGDTALIAYGGGTIASRTAVLVGNAVADASTRLKEQVLKVASDRLETAPEDLEIVDGEVRVKGIPSKRLTLAEASAAVLPGGGSPRLAGPGLEQRGAFEPSRVTFASGVHVAIAEVDVGTGEVGLLRYVVVHDCGRVINPVIVEGQIAGGVAQGIGGALLEELVYNEDAQLITGSFMDYLIPRAPDVPDLVIVHMETPSTLNPLGIKGVGEGGAISPPAAVIGAIEDALAPFEVSVSRCPMPPNQVAGLLPESPFPVWIGAQPA
ncbi:MAG TPA: xanthine dehydrogenase family protein molybdopterin-binding subunit [Actinomycetota bacterium]|jgi:carbon-monoxide dehydrogenase large subunit